MLPRATHTRTARERAQIGGRTQEIQRLIGRSVRAMLDDFEFGRVHDQGGLRRAAGRRRHAHRVDHRRVRRRGAMPSTGWCKRGEARGVAGAPPRRGGERRHRSAASARLDLDYAEDVRAEVDMNVVMSSEGRFVEVQGTGEHGTFDRAAARATARARRAAAFEALCAHKRSALGAVTRAVPAARHAQRGQAARAATAVRATPAFEVIDLDEAGHRGVARRGRDRGIRLPSRRTRSPRRATSTRWAVGCRRRR